MMLDISVSLLCFMLTLPAWTIAAEPAALSADDLVKMAITANPQVKSAEAQYQAALHQIDQAYTPQDPQVSWSENNSPTGINHPASETFGVSESFQFPGKAWLQGDEAHRNAEIAKLTYLAAVRDAKAQAETAYYQALLDADLADTAIENASSLERVLKVAQVAYSANQVPQSDLISAEFDLAQASQTYRASAVAEANDEAALNQALGRDPRSALTLARRLELKPLQSHLDALVDKGLVMRQEILEAALTEKNSRTALKLAWMEMLPDFNLSYSRNRYIQSSSPPSGDSNATPSDNTVSLGINLPVFFWFKQKEDAASANHLLEAVRENRNQVELQAKTSITQLYRSTRLANDTALLYRDSLIPLARQDFQVALIAYQSGKVDFATLSGTLQRIFAARISYLTAANQFLAGRVALEQAIGEQIQL
jgi:outer membrane protein TolC